MRDTTVSDATLARSRPFVLRYYERRREVLTATPRDAEPSRLFEQLALAAIPGFAHWVAVVDPTSRTSFSRCVLAHEHSFHTCAEHWANGLDIDAAVTDVLSTGEGLVWNADVIAPHGVVSRLMVEDHSAGAVLVARDAHASPWDADDLEAVHDVVTALGRRSRAIAVAFRVASRGARQSARRQSAPPIDSAHRSPWEP